ncbi:MAG: glycoside hydrolase family 2 TIM barrel-domain containing protein [Bacteroidota bacterium]
MSKAEIIRTDGKFQLVVDGHPFFIKGAGLEFGDIAALAREGGNAFRTWRVENGEKTGLQVLDEAHANGLKVMMGIEVARERHGFDYNDKTAVRDQMVRIKREIYQLKDHPALIIWCIGNELNLHANNQKVWDAVNELSKMIHAIDPYHLTTTALAGFDKNTVSCIKDRSPDLDFLSVQLYGELEKLPALLRVSGWEGPFLVSEWGATGYWEVPKTSWGAPIEDNSSEKARAFMSRYENGIEPVTTNCIGSFVFLWGQKQERTSTWFGMHTLEGRKTEVVDVMRKIWTGKWSGAKCPKVKEIHIGGKYAKDDVELSINRKYVATAVIEDAGNIDELEFKWELRKESKSTASGGDFEEVPPQIALENAVVTKNELQFYAPKERGEYRLYVYINDRDEYTAHANIPTKVI